MKNLVSVIIPTFNRAHLIEETLDTVLSQTLEAWECIIVDDGSSDDTLEVLTSYAEKDERISFYQRPDELPKGANACRNYGFSKSSGAFIVWFDSDDLMTSNHLQDKLERILEKDLDFVVAKTQNFDGDRILPPYEYVRPKNGITASDFILSKIHWYTYDVMLKRSIAIQIQWNEQMRSWQDYNYFSKMLMVTQKGGFLDKVLTRRRLHGNSIQKSLTSSPGIFNAELLENRLLTFCDVSMEVDFVTKRELIFGMMNLCFELARMRMSSEKFEKVKKIVKNELGLKSLFYLRLALWSTWISGKGYYFLNKAKKR